MISLRAGLKKVPWDGYLKYSRPSPKHSERKYVILSIFLSLIFVSLVYVGFPDNT